MESSSSCVFPLRFEVKLNSSLISLLNFFSRLVAQDISVSFWRCKYILNSTKLQIFSWEIRLILRKSAFCKVSVMKSHFFRFIFHVWKPTDNQNVANWNRESHKHPWFQPVLIAKRHEKKDVKTRLYLDIFQLIIQGWFYCIEPPTISRSSAVMAAWRPLL